MARPQAWPRLALTAAIPFQGQNPQEDTPACEAQCCPGVLKASQHKVVFATELPEVTDRQV